MYTTHNFQSKKALREAVKDGKRVTVWQPGPFPANTETGWVSLEGPHYPKPHRWYARARLENGAIVEIR